LFFTLPAGFLVEPSVRLFFSFLKVVVAEAFFPSERPFSFPFFPLLCGGDVLLPPGDISRAAEFPPF